MTWEERINGIPFTIVTGDGREFKPLFKSSDSEKSKEFNTTAFNFINVYGTLVDRKKPKSGKFPLTFYFEGEDNIGQVNAFENSADDPRAWTITHPIYDTIRGQPLSITRKDLFLNSTQITVDFWESIDADYPTTNFSVKDNTRDKHDLVYIAASESYVNNTVFAPTDVSKNKESLESMAGVTLDLQTNTTYANFQNALNKGLKAIDNLLSGPLNAIQTVQLFLDLPATYVRAVEGRLASYEATFRNLKQSVITLTDKKYFESIGASTIASVCLTAVNPVSTDYITMSDIEDVADRLVSMYVDYVLFMDGKRVSVYDVKNGWNPDAEVQSKLSSLVNFTLGNLYELTFQAKRERTIFTSEKTNVILLTHRYIGLDSEDENINTMIANNNLRFNELFSIEKGREIKYIK
jgi:hypothetical protein